MKRAALLLVLTVAFGSSPLPAQNSVFGTRGIGFPGRAVSVRSLALGGGSAMFDPTSAVNPALAASFRGLTVSASSGTTYRNYTAVGTDVTGLQETRFPFVFLGGGIARSPLSFQISLSNFVERTFRLASSDSVMVGGAMIAVSDTVLSDGGIVDVRAAVGWTASSRLNLGGAVHLLAGSARVSATRSFDNGEFIRFQETDDLSFSGNGASAGVLWAATTAVHLALAGRVNTSLRSRLGDGSFQDISMPARLAGGVAISLTPSVRWMTSTQLRTWSRSEADLASTGSRAFDTWEVGSGLEVGTTSKFPLRLGVRYAQIPFSHNEDQPTEWNFSFGTGTRFAANRAVIDVALQRFQRDGAGARERGWYVTAGITVAPAR